MERQTINQILDLRFANKTYEEIATTVGYTARTVGRVLGKHRADLALMHSQWLELSNEKLQNDFRAQATHRATILHELRGELSSRKFSEIPVDKLMRMIEQGERAMRETENQLTKMIQRGNQSIDGHLMEVDEPSFMRSLTSPETNRFFSTPPAATPVTVPVAAPSPAPTLLPAPSTTPKQSNTTELIDGVDVFEPVDHIPADWTPEEEALYQQMVKEEAEDLAQQAKITAMLKTPIPSAKSATPKKKAA
jgi:hypothetical protein